MANFKNVEECLRQFDADIENYTDIYISSWKPVSIRSMWNVMYKFWTDKNDTFCIEKMEIKKFLSTNLSNHSISYEDFSKWKKRFDFKYKIESWTNYRVNASFAEWEILLIFRKISVNVIEMEKLWINTQFLSRILESDKWLFLISGPTWSGKSTTMASIIDVFNKNRESHIVTLEDPIEFIHKDKKSVIHQVELWSDMISFEDWIENVMRQDPDIIVIWEIRNKNTLDIALKLAETGHLVIASIHWKWANWVLWKVVRMYENEKYILWMLSDVLIWILYQEKFFKEDWKTVICLETLYNTSEVSAWLKQDKLVSFVSNMQTGIDKDMTTMEQYLENYMIDWNELSPVDIRNIKEKITNTNEM